MLSRDQERFGFDKPLHVATLDISTRYPVSFDIRVHLYRGRSVIVPSGSACPSPSDLALEHAHHLSGPYRWASAQPCGTGAASTSGRAPAIILGNANPTSCSRPPGDLSSREEASQRSSPCGGWFRRPGETEPLGKIADYFPSGPAHHRHAHRRHRDTHQATKNSFQTRSTSLRADGPAKGLAESHPLQARVPQTPCSTSSPLPPAFYVISNTGSQLLEVSFHWRASAPRLRATMGIWITRSCFAPCT
jgi:hypothetical protein